MEALIEKPVWNFPLAHWRQHSPSRSAGISFDEEVRKRSKGIEYISRLASHLRLPAQTVFAASLFLHRFYSRCSLKTAHPYEISASCVFLACKTEDSPRKLREVAAAICLVAQKFTDMKLAEVQQRKPDLHEQWQRVILQREGELLETLLFDFENTAPYAFLDTLVQNHVPKAQQNKLGPKALSFVNDSCRTLLSVEISLEELAVTALYWAAAECATTLPAAEDGREWYEQYISHELISQSVKDMSTMMKIVRGGGSQGGQEYNEVV